MGLYASAPLTFADTATMLLLDAQDRAGAGDGPGGRPAGLASYRVEVDQATGMLTEQLGLPGSRGCPSTRPCGQYRQEIAEAYR